MSKRRDYWLLSLCKNRGTTRRLKNLNSILPKNFSSITTDNFDDITFYVFYPTESFAILNRGEGSNRLNQGKTTIT